MSGGKVCSLCTRSVARCACQIAFKFVDLNNSKVCRVSLKVSIIACGCVEGMIVGASSLDDIIYNTWLFNERAVEIIVSVLWRL